VSAPKPRVWTVEEANGALPDLSFRIGRQMVLLSEIEERLRRLEACLGTVDETALEPAADDPPSLATLKADLRDRLDRFRVAWREVEELGVVVKDPRVGLVDFYGEVDGDIVFLCWQYGEPQIGFWHPLDGGFAARQPLETVTRERVLN
jgi:hypothetical protein